MKEVHSQVLSRRDFLWLIGATALSAGISALPANEFLRTPVHYELGENVTPRQYIDMAQSAFTALEVHLMRSDGTYKEYSDVTPLQRFADFFIQIPELNWSLSRLFAATLDMKVAHILPDNEIRGLINQNNQILSQFWQESQPLGSPGYLSEIPKESIIIDRDKFYDDNGWDGLNLIRGYRLTGDPFCIEQTQRVFEFIKTGWAKDEKVKPGGIFWKEQKPGVYNHDRNTVSTLPGCMIALRLAQHARSSEERDTLIAWGLTGRQWAIDTLRDPGDGLMWDHIDRYGRLDKSKFSYNQGLAVATDTLAFEVTRDPAYLESAETTAREALKYFSVHKLSQNEVAFNEIFFRNLLYHFSRNPNKELYGNTLHLMQDYARLMWSDPNRHDSNGIFSDTSWSATRPQSSMIAIFSMLSLPSAYYPSLI